MVVGMAAPASAADNPTWKSAFITLFNDYMGKLVRPEGYDYTAVFYCPAKLVNSTTTEYMSIFFSKTPVISIGDHFYYDTMSCVVTGVSTYYVTYAKRYFLKLDYIRNGVSASGWFGYYISSVSTASIEGMYDVGVTEPWIYDIEVPLPNSSALQALIIEALSKNESDYTADSWQQLNAALTSAQNLLASSYYTQTQVNEALEKLNNAMNSLVLRPSTSGLVDLLNTAKSIQNNNYTDASWSDLQAAIEVAETLLSFSSYTQVQVDSALGRLNNAMNSLVAKPAEPPPEPKPPVILERDYALIGTGEVTPFINGYETIFLNNALTVLPIIIGLFTVLLGIFLIRKIFRIIMR